MKSIYTIGYGNRKMEDFLTLLKGNHIQILVDVRSSPFSRFNPAFRRTIFEQHLKKAEIEYWFKGDELGGKPLNPNLYLNGVLSYDAVRSTPQYQGTIKQLVMQSKQALNICIMCSELDENNCHRKMLLADDLIREGVGVLHIDKRGSLISHNTELKLL